METVILRYTTVVIVLLSLAIFIRYTLRQNLHFRHVVDSFFHFCVYSELHIGVLFFMVFYPFNFILNVLEPEISKKEIEKVDFPVPVCKCFA